MRAKSVRGMIITAMFAAVMCVIAPVTITIGTQVPITLSVFAVYLVSVLLPPVRALIAVVVYIILGLIGLPVFSNFTGGLSVVIGPTGGFLASYPFMALIISVCLNHENRTVRWIIKTVLSLLATLVICYLSGTAWFAFSIDTSVINAIKICVLPFIPFDILKAAAAFAVGFAVFKQKRLYSMLRQ